jgi:hypothetical protein
MTDQIQNIQPNCAKCSQPLTLTAWVSSSTITEKEGDFDCSFYECQKCNQVSISTGKDLLWLITPTTNKVSVSER